MNKDRYDELMEDDGSILSAEERAQGWHFCNEFDGLLVGPGMGELQHCTNGCLPDELRQKLVAELEDPGFGPSENAVT